MPVARGLVLLTPGERTLGLEASSAGGAAYLKMGDVKLHEFEVSHLRHVLSHFPTGVVVVTGMDCGEPVGLTVGSFTSVSLDPPLIGFFPSKDSTSWPRIARAESFAVNILAEYQEDICRGFAVRGGDKFADLPWHQAHNGAPMLDEAIAWIECGVRSVTETGDHWFVLGEVRGLSVNNGSGPLVFFRGQYKGLRP